VESLLSVSPWRELFWIAIGGIFFSLLCVSGALLRAALWPPPRAGRRTVETRSAAMAATARESDDLETIEGIGPAIAALLRTHGIRSFAALAAYRPAELRIILRRDGDLALAEPSTWPLQARLLAEGRHGDFVRLIALLNCGVPRLCNVDGLEECCAARLRAGGICTVAELQRSTVARVVNCFPQNDRAQVTRWAPRWIEHAALLHEGDEAAWCALAGIGRPSGQVRAETRRGAAQTAAAVDGVVAETGLAAYWRRESWLRLLCAPLGGLALLLFLLLIALLGLIPSGNAPGSNVVVRGGGGGTTISMVHGGWPPQNGQNLQYWQYGPYGPYPAPYPPPYPPYPPYPAYPTPSPYPPSPYPAPYPPSYPPSYPAPYPAPGSCCPPAATSCNYAPCPAPAPAPAPSPARETCDCSASESCDCGDAY